MGNQLNASRDEAAAIWSAGVAAVDPGKLVRDHSQTSLASRLMEEKVEEVLVLGAGKAGQAMARGLREGLPRSIRLKGLVLVPEGGQCQVDGVEVRAVRPPGANLPTPLAMAGTLEMLGLATRALPGQRVVALVSGGASAMTPAPVDGITLEDKLTTTQVLSRSGADIHQLNTVRKHLSRFKGGGLAAAVARSPLGGLSAMGSRLFALIISDVVGDPLEVIGSGPTVADPSTFADCLDICQTLGVWQELPASVRTHLEKGFSQPVQETLKVMPTWVENSLLGSNRHALQTAADFARGKGWPVLNLGPFFEGDTRSLAAFHLALFRSIRQGLPQSPPVCVLSGGETTVKLGPNPGPGGRNQEFALSLLRTLKKEETSGFSLLAAGTDGEDGPTPAAGGFVDTQAWDALDRFKRSDPASFHSLLAHDENHAILKECQALFQPGPTGTNVMDLRVGLLTR